MTDSLDHKNGDGNVRGKTYAVIIYSPFTYCKPNTASGAAAGARQTANYEKQLGAPARTIYYDPEKYRKP